MLRWLFSVCFPSTCCSAHSMDKMLKIKTRNICKLMHSCLIEIFFFPFENQINCWKSLKRSEQTNFCFLPFTSLNKLGQRKKPFAKRADLFLCLERLSSIHIYDFINAQCIRKYVKLSVHTKEKWSLLLISFHCGCSSVEKLDIDCWQQQQEQQKQTLLLVLSKFLYYIDSHSMLGECSFPLFRFRFIFLIFFFVFIFNRSAMAQLN